MVLIPRAMSTDIADERYRHDYPEIGPKLMIRLDGVEQKLVVTYDQDAGFVVCPVLNADGHIQLDPATKDEVWVAKSYGVVDVTLRDDLSDLDRAILYGDGRTHYRGLLPPPSTPCEVPEVMTRQRRRAAARQASKGGPVHQIGGRS